MLRHIVSWGVTAACLVALPSLTRAQADDVTPEKVRAAIKRGVEYLKSKQNNGSWEHLTPGLAQQRGGVSALAMLALLEAGVEPEDDTVQAGLQYLRRLEPQATYVVSLQTMVFCKAEPQRDRLLIKRNVDWLMQTARRQGGDEIAWGYPFEGGLGPDNSNTQYAVLALREAGLAGVPIKDQEWKQIQNYYLRTQLPTAGWSYPTRNIGAERITMTSAGVCGLLISGMQLYRNQEQINADGTIDNCGKNQANDPLARGIRRLGETFNIKGRRGNMMANLSFRFYNMYGIERAGRLSGLRFFKDVNNGNIDWYRIGAAELIATQSPNGNWTSSDTLDGNPIIATSFSLLFLSKGKTPVLIHKLTHGPDRDLTGDWNNDKNDVRNLTEFCSQQIFKKNGRPVPLTWQIFDASRLRAADPQSLSDMLQAPIAFFNGHRAPRFTDGEKFLLKAYIDQGGFIFAEACCGRPEFDEGFRNLIQELFPDRALEPLPPGHAIWEAAFRVKPGSFDLHGLDLGCKTVLVYAPKDMSCHWESNDVEGRNQSRTLEAFRLAANIVAYATGLEPPEDKLTQKNITKNTFEESKVVRNHLQIAQLNYGGRDWQPAPNAMRVLVSHLNKKHGIDVVLQTKPIVPLDPNLRFFKFLYMHGRREFTMSDEQQLALRQHLETGGMLLADAACGNESFDKAFRTMIEKTFGRPLEPLKPEDPFFSSRIGKELRSVQGRTRRGQAYAPLAPQLEGIRLDAQNPQSRWIVIYSKLDLGCVLDKHASSDCLGYDHDSALDLAAQAVLYALRE
jgi:hypothetical protein